MIQKNLALFASGRGSNALNIIDYFNGNSSLKIAFVLCNKANASIVASAREKGINVIVCQNEDIEKPNYLTEICEKNKVSTVILAGFLRKIPADFVQNYPNRIINIHPSLLPKYGGEGMYGKFVHEAVLENGDKETGITIHYVNEEYDKGEIIAQFKCPLTNQESVESIQTKIHALEMEYFPKIIEKVMNDELKGTYH